MHLSTVKDISQILRRQCPLETNIIETSRSLENHHDNLWLMEEEEGEALAVKWNISNDHAAVGRKRRKLDAEDPPGELPHFNDRHDRIRAETPALLGKTTMQNRAAFSYLGSGGFTSAAAQLRSTTEAECHSRQTKLSRERARLLIGAVHRTGDGTHVNLGDKLKDQGRLLTLWSKSAANHVPDCIAKSGLEPRRSHDSTSQKNKDHVSHGGGAGNPPSAPHRTEVSQLKRPLAVIPQELANHKLPPLAHQARHHPIEINQTSKHYAFLSSSPPAIDEQGPEKTNLDRGVGASLSTNATLNKSVSKATAYGENMIRPAQTFHQTSMAQLKEGANYTRKTLGIRRSMTGWTCRGKQRPSVPNKTSQ